MAAFNSRRLQGRWDRITHAPTPAYRSAQTRRPARRRANERAHGVRRRNAGRGHPFALRRGHQRPHDAHPRGGLAHQRRAPQPPLPPAPARLPRAGLQLAEGHAAARRRRLPRGRPRPARIRTHHGLGPRLRRRPARLRHAESGPRCAGPRRRAGPRLRGRRDRPRLRLPGRRLLRADPAGCLPVGGDDERAVRRPARTAGGRVPRLRSGRLRLDPARSRGPPRAAQALSGLLLHPTGQRRHAQRTAGIARLPARLLPHEERRLEAEPAAPARSLDGRRAGQAAQLLRDAVRRRHARAPSPATCPAPP